jgi:hypothetical protein
MRRILSISIVFLLFSLLASCRSVETFTDQNYRLGLSQSCAIGDPIVSYSVVDSWDYPPPDYGGPGSFKQELIYTGRSGDTIHASYREYMNDLARPSFFNDLQYDLHQSQIIVYKRYRIKVLSATNESITYIVIEDGGHEIKQ